MYIYKIVFGLTDAEHGTFDIKLKGGISTRSGTHCHALCVEETHGRINARRHCFKSPSSSGVKLSPCQCYQF